jgi:hypothetical protein
MDDAKVAYKRYEKMVKPGIKNVCIPQGPFRTVLHFAFGPQSGNWSMVDRTRER